MGLDIDELITRFDEIENLFSKEDAQIVEDEGLEDNKELSTHRRASVLRICRMTKRELLKIKARQEQKSQTEADQGEQTGAWSKVGRFMGTAGEAPQYE